MACLQQGAKCWASARSQNNFEAFTSTVPEHLRPNLRLRKVDSASKEESAALLEEILALDVQINHVVSSMGGWQEHGMLSDVSVEAFKAAIGDMSMPHFICYSTFAKVLAQTPGSTYTFVTGGSAQDNKPFPVRFASASMLAPTTALIYGMYSSAECENRENVNLEINQLRIHFFIRPRMDSEFDEKNSEFEVGKDFIGRFFPKVMNVKRGGLTVLENRTQANATFESY